MVFPRLDFLDAFTGAAGQEAGQVVDHEIDHMVFARGREIVVILAEGRPDGQRAITKCLARGAMVEHDAAMVVDLKPEDTRVPILRRVQIIALEENSSNPKHLRHRRQLLPIFSGKSARLRR